ncbi:MAG: nucleotidyltransferase domain-containing protein [Candidatus Andersenbacteria bacterium]|nr:nucleotidyltransferase domain-containing protein [Candidatus Andersenbacteria bacterium]
MVRKKIYTNKEVKKIIFEYKKLLKEEDIEFNKIYLFGSYAKKRPRDWSDIDVAVVSKKFGKDSFKEQLLVDRIADKVSYAIEPHPFHPRDFKDKWSSLAFEINEHGIEVV